MPLDADAEAVLTALAAANRPEPGSMPAAEYRALSEAGLAVSPPMPIRRVENLTVDGAAGPLKARLYADTDAAALPLLVYFHGGGWVVFGLDSHDAACRKLAQVSGFAVLSIDYRRAPEAKFPAPFEDCYSATLWAARHAASLGVDPARIAVGGDSAGGNLAAAVALAARDRGGPKLTHQLLINPITNHAFDTESYRLHGEGLVLTARAMRWYWELYLQAPADGDNPYASPLKAGDLSNLPPATVVTAEYDILCDEGEAYARRLIEADAQSELRRFDGVFHGFVLFAGAVGKADQCLRYMGERLRASSI